MPRQDLWLFMIYPSPQTNFSSSHPGTSGASRQVEMNLSFVTRFFLCAFIFLPVEIQRKKDVLLSCWEGEGGGTDFTRGARLPNVSFDQF